MDKILEGILNSSHSEEVKAAVVDRIIQAASTTKDGDIARNIFKYCSSVITKCPNAFSISKTRKIITVWTREHGEVAVNFLSGEMENYFSGCVSVSEKRKWLELVTQMLSISNTLNDNTNSLTVLQKLVQFFLQEEILEVNSSLAQAIIKNWSENLVKGNETAVLSKIIALLQNIKFDFTGEGVNESEAAKESFAAKVTEINTLSALFGKVLSIDSSFLQTALNGLFHELSSISSSSNIALASLLQNFPTELAIVAAEILSKDKSLKNENIQILFEKMINWLSWPGVKNLDVWIISFFKHLLMEKERQELVIELIRKNIMKIFQHLCIPSSRETALPIFSYTMLVYQHHPGVFLQVAPKIPALISKIKEESTNIYGPSTIKIIAELVYTLMYNFPKHPAVYADLRESIKDFPRPSEESMKRWLSESNCLGKTSTPAQPIVQVSQLNRKLITGKTGLVNLGNTCYMNSVIQALFMLERFRESLLSMSLHQDKNNVTYNLQQLAAFLLLSERSAISPIEFNRVSRPSWFRQGAQQDCSEFLKYLIDVIEQEDKSRESEAADGKENEQLHEMFTGECRVDVKCLNCNYVSSRYEAFNDIPLSFPDNTDGGTYGLKGGDISRGIGNTIANAAGSISPNDTAEVTKPTDHPLLETAEPAINDPIEKDNQQRSILLNIATDTKPLELQRLLDNYLSSEYLVGQNQYRCDNCASLQDAEQRHYFASCPKYLVLTLKRFTYDMKTHTRSKILKNVRFPSVLAVPLNIVTSDRTLDEDVEMQVDSDPIAGCSRSFDIDHQRATEITCKTPKLSMITESSKQYTLVAVIVHSGVSSESGHYYCYSRKGPSHRQLNNTDNSPTTDARTVESSSASAICSDGLIAPKDQAQSDTRWYIFNDSNVSYAASNAVENLHINLPRDTPYVFIYEANDTQEMIQKASGINPDLVSLVQEDNRKFIKEQDQKSRTYSDNTTKFDYFKSRKKDDDNDGAGPSGNCGGAFGGLASDASRFIF